MVTAPKYGARKAMMTSNLTPAEYLAMDPARANYTLTLTVQDDEGFMTIEDVTVPAGVEAYATLSAHCYAVSVGRGCTEHTAHTDTLARWQGMLVTLPPVRRMAVWFIAMNGLTGSGMDAADILQETIVEWFEVAGRVPTIHEALTYAGNVKARMIEVEALQAELMGERIPFEWLE